MHDIPTIIGELARNAAQLALAAAPSSIMPAMGSENWMNSMLDRKLQQRQIKETEIRTDDRNHQELFDRIGPFWDDLTTDLEQQVDSYNAHTLIAERIELNQQYKANTQRLGDEFHVRKSRFPDGRLLLRLDRKNERIVYLRRHTVEEGSAKVRIEKKAEFIFVLEHHEIHLEEKGKPVKDPIKRFLSKFLSVISVDSD